jgi:1-aminocyclopropane-1-carboxylate deaminase
MSFFSEIKVSKNQQIITSNDYKITIKREDQIDLLISGNKYRKLRHPFIDFVNNNVKQILTFGGAFSNHLAAFSKAGKINKISTLGIVRGQEWKLKIDENPTLKYCLKNGMQLFFVTREEYRLYQNGATFIKINSSNPNIEIVSEGGSSLKAIQGCKEIIQKNDEEYDVICVSVGTGATMAGIIEASFANQIVYGFLSLNHFNISSEISKFTSKTNWKLNYDYTFGGYGKISKELITFINKFQKKYKILLDPIYNGKMLFGIFDLLENKKWFLGKNILIIHTGGLQGIKGMNIKLKRKGWQIISSLKQ